MRLTFPTVLNFFRPFLIFFRANAYFCISLVVSLALLLLIPQIKEVMLQTPELPRPWEEGVGWGTMLTHGATVASFGYFLYLALLFAVGIAAILCVTPPKRTPGPDANGFAIRRKYILWGTVPIAALLTLVWYVVFQDHPKREGTLADIVFYGYAVALFAVGVAAVIYAAPAPSITSREAIPPLAPLPSWKQWLALVAGLVGAFFFMVGGCPPAIILLGLIVLLLPPAYWVIDHLCRWLWVLASWPLGEGGEPAGAAGDGLAPPDAATAVPAGGARRQATGGGPYFTRRRRWWALGAAVVGLVLIVGSRALAPLDSPWPMFDYPLTILGFLFLGLAACYLLGRWVEQWAGARRSHRAMGRILAWLLFSFTFGEAVWALAYFPSTNRLVSYRLYTIWGVLRLVVLIVLVASLFDTLDEETAPPWRIFGLVCVVLVALVFRVPNPEGLREPALGEDKVPNKPADWVRHLKQRIDHIPDIEDENGKKHKGPVVLVAASGGGSRAAIFAGLVLDALSRESFCEKAGAKWGDHIVLVSGVSGGSLGSARYISGRGRQRDKELRAALLDSIPLELASRMVKAANEILEERQKDLEEMTKKTPKNPDKRQKEELERKKQTVKAAELTKQFCAWRLAWALNHDSDRAKTPSADAEEAKQLRELEWVVQSPIMDDLCMDFMAPVLRGALTPLESRGQALRRFWASRFGWEQSLDRAGYAAERDKPPSFDPKKHPLAIYNSSDVRRGVRIAVGFPPLPPNFLGAGAFAAADDAAADDRGSRYPPECLADLDSDRSMYLADAVALSANFPFGFNAITFDRDSGEDRKKLRQEGDLAVRILDGGIVDNTGIDTLFLVLAAIRAEARSTRPGHDPAPYQAIWKELLDRRVYLIEIDSGAKPEKPGPATKLLSVVLDPLGALNNASFTNSARDKRHYFDALGDLLSRPVDLSSALEKLGKDPAKLPPEEQELFRELCHRQAAGIRRFTWVTFDANHFQGENVQTAWSLAPRDKALLLARFLNELVYQKPNLKELCKTARKDQATDSRAVVAAADEAVAKALKQRLARAIMRFNHKQQQGDSPRGQLTTLDEVVRHLNENETWAKKATPPDRETAAQLNELKKTAEKRRDELKAAVGRGAPTVKGTGFTIKPGDSFQVGERALKDSLEKLKTAGPTQALQEELSCGAAERRRAFNQPKR